MLSRADMDLCDPPAVFANGPPGIKPADLPDAALPGDHVEARTRWPKWLKEEFAAMEPAAVWVGGPRDLLSVTVYHPDGSKSRYGHNRLTRPVKAGISESWRDTVTPRMDQVAYWQQGLLVRIWVGDDAAAKRLLEAVIDALEHLDEGELVRYRREFIEIGPETNIDMLGQHLLDVAKGMGIQAWDDDGLVHHLTQTHAAKVAARHARAAQKGGRR